ncbi:hypothetical protein, partial [Vibrio sp. Vb0587]|uniref:hypothetical protein n=1 Tax=Vibrio sp. Vb0587 TaxID=3074626 RepID=UPI00296448EC
AGESVAVACYVHHFSCARKVGGIKLSTEKTLLFNQTKHRESESPFSAEKVLLLHVTYTIFVRTKSWRYQVKHGENVAV